MGQAPASPAWPPPAPSVRIWAPPYPQACTPGHSVGAPAAAGLATMGCAPTAQCGCCPPWPQQARVVGDRMICLRAVFTLQCYDGEVVVQGFAFYVTLTCSIGSHQSSGHSNLQWHALSSQEGLAFSPGNFEISVGCARNAALG